MKIKIPFIPAIGIIALIALLLGTVVVLGSLAIKGKSVSLYSFETPKPKDKTADWETYRNEEYGYEVKYPEELKIKGEINISSPIYNPSHNPADYPSSCYYLHALEEEPVRLLNEVIFSTEERKLGISVDVHDNLGNLSLIDWLNWGDEFVSRHPECEDTEYIRTRQPINQTEIYVAEIKGTKGIYMGCCSICHTEVFIPRDKKIYRLGLKGTVGNYNSDTICSHDDISEDIFNQMLFTFKFID